MKSCHSQIIINAPVSKVWSILVDFKQYKKWNPLIGNVWGTVQEGGLAFAHVVPLLGVFPIRITRFSPQQELIWQGKAFSSKLMMGEHYYALKDLGNGQTELQHGEIFTGLGSKLIPSFVLSKLQETYK